METPSTSKSRKRKHADAAPDGSLITSGVPRNQLLPLDTERCVPRQRWACTPRRELEAVHLAENVSKEPLIDRGLQGVRMPPRKGGKARATTADEGGNEKRSRRFRQSAPQSYQQRLERALTQRMFVIDRNRGGTVEVPEERIDLAGTTGNIYQITIGKEPTCTCPDNKVKGNQCKYMIYILAVVLKVPLHLRYQLAFISSELREIFAQAPAPVKTAQKLEAHDAGKRKAIEGLCPVCFLDLEADTDDIVWCKAACGNNIHEHCFEQWAASQRGKEVKCVYCRTPWYRDVYREKLSTEGILNEEGYVNVADQLGLDGRRDYSSYHQPWVRQMVGRRR